MLDSYEYGEVMGELFIFSFVHRLMCLLFQIFLLSSLSLAAQVLFLVSRFSR